MYSSVVGVFAVSIALPFAFISVSSETDTFFRTPFLVYLLCNPSLPISQKTDISHPSIVKLTDYINNNFNKHLTLEESAKKLNMSRTYLSNLFHNNTGFTFKNYLSIIRIKHAKEFLRNTNKSVVDIAYECGFDDSNYFSTAFKKSEDMSPLEYRKTSRLSL